MSKSKSGPHFYDCIYCKTPWCVWDLYENRVIEDTEADVACDMVLQHQYEHVPNNLKRKRAYQIFVDFVFGRLGKNNCIKLTTCVKRGIRRHYPSADGKYMGHKNE